MKLKEYQGKELLKKYGIKIPKGQVISSIKTLQRPDKECVIKAQLLTGKRWKSGGVKFSEPGQTADICRKILETPVNGEKVEEVLVEERLAIEKEIYLSITIDRFNQDYLLIYSHHGGAYIEETIKKKPNTIKRLNFTKLDEKELRKTINTKEVIAIAKKLFDLVKKENALLAEINPLVMTNKGEFIAADAKIILDDNALNLEKGRLSYVKLEGDIGIVGNGAGLVMATLDTFKQLGGEPACFLDLSGGTGADAMKTALQTVLANPKVKVLFINIFAGITRCDEIANGIIDYLGEEKISVPVVVRMAGTNEQTGRQMLEQKGIKSVESMEEGVKQILREI